MPFSPTAYPGTLHHYAPRLVAFEHPLRRAQIGDKPRSYLLFLGGLSDSLRTVTYPAYLAQKSCIPDSCAVVEVQLSSSGAGWTTSTLSRDADELALCVSYFRKEVIGDGDIHLMGHSTGAQICTTYLIGSWKEPQPSEAVLAHPPVQGLILQAGISDREAMSELLPAQKVESSLQTAKDWVAKGHGGEVLPTGVTSGILGANPSAERWISLVDPEGDDDLFSSDLSDERVHRVWGKPGIAGREVPVLVLLGDEDEHMPKRVDKEQLLDRWKRAVESADGTWHGASGVVVGASHNLNESSEKARYNLGQRVSDFLGDFE